MTDNALRHPPSAYVNGTFIPVPDGDDIVSRNPADPTRVIWQGSPDAGTIEQAVHAARAALPAWSRRPIDERIEYLRRWQEVTRSHKERIAGLITDEMGKVMAESLFEAGALAGKVDITLDDISRGRVSPYQVSVGETRSGYCRFKPHGVMAVIGPFNFPAHLPNGHFIPALLTGNTVVLKPSEKTAAVGQLLAEMMDEVDLPNGVFNVVHGTGAIAASLVSHDGVDGVLFTGSWPVGRRILEANLDSPGRIVALELGGNNPAVVMDDADLRQAVVECARASFATTGQRCTCTRRIIVQRGIAEQFIPALCRVTSTLQVGSGRAETPVFMGPIISDDAARAVLEHQEQLHGNGGRVLVQSVLMDGPGHFVTPGVVEVDAFTIDRDCEVFGPLVQVAIVDDLDEAIAQANATKYGLAAAIFTRDEDAFETFFHQVNSGCINWNTGTAGASGKLPFGGLGFSGNHRPAGAYSVDYCAYPVANMVETGTDVAVPSGMLWEG